mgnify:CR=1 FL=1
MKKFFIFFLILAFGINLNLSFAQETDDLYKKRRQELSKTLNGAIAIMPSEIQTYGRDNDNKNFYYLTGMQSSNLTLIVTPDLDDKDILVTSNNRLEEEVSKDFEIMDYEEASKKIFVLNNDLEKYICTHPLLACNSMATEPA